MEFYQLIILTATAMASSVVKNGAAVGSGIFVLPVLALAFPPKIALGLGAPIMLVTDIMGIRNYWREWRDWPEILRLFLSGLAGMALGAYCLYMVPGNVFKLCIGAFAVAYSLVHLFKDIARSASQSRQTDHPELCPDGTSRLGSLAIGALGGLASIMAHSGGIVWSTYYAGEKLDKRCFVGSLLLLFTMSDVLKLVSYIQLDILTARSILIILAMSPLLALASNWGNTLNKRMGQELFRRIVLILILAAGASLLWG